MADAFISYSRCDAPKAKRVMEHLRSHRLEPWVDTDDRIAAGDRWSEVIQRAIEESASFVVLVTPNSLISHEVAREIEHARLHGKPVIPLILSLPDGATKGDGSSAPIDFTRLPVWLVERQVIDARSEPWTQALEQLGSAVRRDHHWRSRHGELLGRARRWKDGSGSLLSDRDLAKAREWLEHVPSEIAQPTDLQRSYIRASTEAQTQRRVEKADRIAELVLSGFYDPDMAIPLAAENIEVNAASHRAVLALDRALRQSRSLGAIGPSGEIEKLRFLDDGERLFIGYRHASAVVVRVADGEMLADWEFGGLGRNIRAVSGGGTMIVEDGGVILLVDPLTQRSERLKYHLPSDLAAADFDSTGRWLVTADHHGQAWLWDMQQTKPVQELVSNDHVGSRVKFPANRRKPEIEKGGHLRGHTILGDEPITAALSDDARYAGVGRDFPREGYSVLTVHDTRNGRQVLRHRFDWAITSLCFRPGHHDLLYVCDGEGFVQPLPHGAPLRLAGGLRDIEGALVGSPDGRLVGSVGVDGFVRVFEFDAREQLCALGGHDYLSDVGPAFSGNGVVATGLVHGDARLWDVRGDGEQRQMDVRACPSQGQIVIRDPGVRPLVQVSISPDGSRLCTTAQSMLACIWDVEQLENICALYPTPAAEEGYLAWLKDGCLVAIPHDDPQSVYRFRAKDDYYEGEVLLQITRTEEHEAAGDLNLRLPDQVMEEGWYSGLAVSTDGNRLAVQVAGWERFVEVWSLDPLKRLISLTEGDLRTLSTNGDCVLLTDEHSGYALWSVAKGERLKVLGPVIEKCHLATWSPRGSHFAVAHGALITIVDSEGRDKPVDLVGHRARVLSIVFSPLGDRLVSSAQDGSLRVWNTRTGAELRRLDIARHAVTTACFTADGESVLSGSTDSLVRVWRLWSLDELQNLAKQRGTDLSEENRRRFGLRG